MAGYILCVARKGMQIVYATFQVSIEVASFPGTHEKKGKGAPGIHCLRMLDSPHFSGELGN